MRRFRVPRVLDVPWAAGCSPVDPFDPTGVLAELSRSVAANAEMTTVLNDVVSLMKRRRSGHRRGVDHLDSIRACRMDRALGEAAGRVAERRRVRAMS